MILLNGVGFTLHVNGIAVTRAQFTEIDCHWYLSAGELCGVVQQNTDMMPTGAAATLATPAVAAAACASATSTVTAATPTVAAVAVAAVPTMRVKRKAHVISSTVSTEEKLNRIQQGRSVLARWLQEGAAQPDGGMHLLSTASGEEVDRVLTLQTQFIHQLKAEREAQKPPGVSAKENTSMPRPAALLATNADGRASVALRTGSQVPPAATAQHCDLDRYCGLVVGDAVKLQGLELSSYKAFNGKRAVIQRIAQSNKKSVVFYVEVDGEGAAVARANLGLKAKPPPGRMSPTWLPCFSNQVNYVGASGLATNADERAPTQDAPRMEPPGAGAHVNTSMPRSDPLQMEQPGATGLDAAASADKAPASFGRVPMPPLGCTCCSASSEALDVDTAVQVLMPEPRTDVKEYYDQRLYALAGEKDRQDWCLHKDSKTHDEARALLQKGLGDLLRPPPEHAFGDEASPVSYLQATVFKLICHCPAECCCRRPPGSCPSKTARKDKYLLHIDNIEQVSLRPSKTWFPPGGLKEYLTKLLNSEQARAEQLVHLVQTKKRRFERENLQEQPN